jgi:fructosamine-3-kinase
VTDEVWRPGDRERVAEALTAAREAGVSEAEIEAIVLEVEAGPQDRLTTIVLSGRLWSAARARQPRAPVESPWRV